MNFGNRIGWELPGGAGGGGGSVTLNGPQSIYFSPAQNLDPTFLVFATCIPAVLNAFVNGTPIQWGLLDFTTGHESSFFNGVQIVGDGLRINYPTVKQVLFSQVTTDEKFGTRNVTTGASVGFSFMTFNATTPLNPSIRLDGNGSANWTLAGPFAATIQISAYDALTGETGIFYDTSAASNLSAFDANLVNVVYMGSNNYHIQRTNKPGWHLGFILKDSANNPVLPTPAAGDIVLISGAATGNRINIPLNVFQNGFNEWFDTSTNFWISGVFECYIVANPVTDDSILVRWQTVPTATDYKIYRSDTGIGGPFNLVKDAGLDGRDFLDTGLIQSTQYVYKLVATLAGVDTDISTFTTNTLTP